MAIIIQERRIIPRRPMLSEPKLETFFSLLRHFSNHTPDRAALIEPSSGRTVSYRQLANRVEELASKLSHLGVRVGTPVVVMMSRGIALVETILAISRLGGWCVPYMAARDLKTALTVAREALAPEYFIYSSEHGRSTELAQPAERWLSFEALDASPDAASVSYEPEGNTILYLNETSGSSNKPKLVPASHAAIIANTAACVQALGITSEDTHMCTFNSHAHEIFARALFTGGTAVLLQATVAEDQSAFLQAMVHQRVTCLMSNATAYTALVQLSNYRPERFSLRLAESGGMPTPETLTARVADRFGARLVAVWGSTETAGVALASQGDRSREGSVGKPLPGYFVKVVDEKGNPVPAGEVGELIISGEAVAGSYLSGGDQTQLGGGTFRTGDRAKIDSEGWVFIRGRIANEFKVAGIVVSAEEIESAISKSEHVSQVAVLPINHPTYGYVPVALVVPKGDDYYSMDRKFERRVIAQIIKEATRHLQQPFFELPTRIKWVRELPRTKPGDKLDRRALLRVFIEEPPQATKVRLSNWRRLRLVADALERKSLLRLPVRNPIGFVRLVWVVLKGDKAK